MKQKEAPEYPENLRRLSHLLTQRVGPGIDLAHFRCREVLDRHQQLPQGELQREFVPGALGAVRQRCEQPEGFVDGGNRFVMGIALGRMFPYLLPIVDGTLDLPPTFEMDGEVGGDLPRPIAIARLQAFTNQPV